MTGVQTCALPISLFFLLPLHRLVAPLPRCNFGLAAVGAPVLDIDDLLARPELPEVAVEQETEQDGKGHGEGQRQKQPAPPVHVAEHGFEIAGSAATKIGRASCGASVCLYV